MTKKTAALALGTALCLAALAADPPETPKDVGMVERASTRLAQLDVTVSGPKGDIENLTADDFEVKINRQLVPRVFVDDLCVAQPAAAATAPSEPSAVDAPQAEAPKPTVATYMLYFDMSHLTQIGRRGAIDASREMLPKLLAGGNRCMIVAAAKNLKTIVPLTSDLQRLDTALAKLVDDSSTYDTYATLEDRRMSDIILEEQRGTSYALNLANRFAAEERWRQERDLRRLSMMLGRLAELDSPKSVLYFADIMRQNAGEHYLAFFRDDLTDANGKPVPDAASTQMDASMGSLPLDDVMNEASGLGIRFYTIEGQGMTVSGTFIESRVSANSGGGGGPRHVASPALSSQRTKDAQTTLGSLAAETGGRSFINGASSAKMAAQIISDLSCIYLVSFDPSGFPQDAPLSVSVEIKRPKVKAVVRGRLVIQSEATRRTARLLAAFASPTATDMSNESLHVGLIPIAYKNGSFRARVQVTMSGTAVAATTWDIGASLVSEGIVRQDGAGRVQVSLPNTPVVFEKDMDFAPGEYELVAVAHEVQTDTMASKELHGSWPKLDAELACLGPISVSQPLTGGFLRNGESRTQGAVVISENEPLRLDTPVAVISLVCRAKDQKRPLRVVRTLYGEQETHVGTTQLDLSSERCGQVVDLIPPRSLGAGAYRFVIAVTADGNELARGERTLVMPERTAPPVKGAS